MASARSTVVSTLTSTVLETAAELGQLAGEIVGAAGEIGELIGRLQPVALAGGDGVIDRKRREHAERHQRQFRAGEAKAQIDHKADRAGDEHHTGGDENGADTHHAGKPSIRGDA